MRLPIQHLPSSYLTVSFLVENPFVHRGTFSVPSPWRRNVLSSAYSSHPDYLPLIHIIKLLCFETFMSKGLRTPAQVSICLLMLPYMDGMILDMLPFPMYWFVLKWKRYKVCMYLMSVDYNSQNPLHLICQIMVCTELYCFFFCRLIDHNLRV